VLLVEDNPGDADLVRETLRDVPHVELAHVEDVAHARARLSAEPVDVVLLDLTLPDASGIEGIELLRQAAPDVPIVVLTGTDDDALGARVVQAGAQDYLVKGQTDERLLLRTMRYAVERHQLQVQRAALLALEQAARARAEAQEVRMTSIAEENARLYGEVRRAVTVREEFISIASHELRTPLTALELQVDGLRQSLEALTDPHRAPLLARCTKVAKLTGRLELLVEDLLDVAKCMADDLVLECHDVDLRALTLEVTERFGEHASRAGCTLEIAPGAPVVGQWDRPRLERLITNLVSNALRYGAGKPVFVTLAAEHDRVELSVRDHGIGIAAADAARIFERFERAVSARRYGGLGLGLHLAREIARAHGGAIDVTSELGKGAVFRLTLPLVASAPAAELG
jgi:signal transduction histidine kinase